MSDGGSLPTDFESTFDSILDTNLDECQVTVCLASVHGESSDPAFQKLQLEEQLADRYRDVVKGVVKQLKKDRDRDDLVLCQHEPGSDPEPHEVEYLKLSEHPQIRDQISPLLSPMDLGIFDDDDSFKSGLRFYVIVVQKEDEEPIYYFRAYSPKKELRRSSSFAAIFTEGHFDLVDEPLLLFDEHLDCISQGDHMYVLQRWNFQQMFRFFELIQEIGQQILDDIKGKVPIQNFDDFVASCINSPIKLAKLRNVSQSGLIERVGMEDIKGLITEYDLAIEVVEENGQDMIVYSSADQWAILRLLDDGYLESVLTEQRYEVANKRPHRARRR